MNALDSPLEALAFDYLSFGILTAVNNVWTWVAVLTAAVSVWRFRTISPRGKSPEEASLITAVSSLQSVSPVERVAAGPVEAALTLTQVEVAKAAPSSCVFNREGRTSGKFTFYYDQEEEVHDGNGDCIDEVDGEDGNHVGKEWLGNGLEVMMRMRMEDDMGFYRYQDLTVLDGSVVRLWDDCRRRSAAASLISCGGDEGSIIW